jgi:hypothetical protein
MNSSVILRSPNLADGGDVRVVRLYEAQGHARGGLAMAGPMREVLMHLTADEADQLRKQWGAPSEHGYGFKAGTLRPVQARADGGWLTGYGPDNTRIPGGTPAQVPVSKLERAQAPLAAPEDYYTYGERPTGEHQFFTGNVTPAQPNIPQQPSPGVLPGGGGSATPQSSGGSDIAAGLGAVLAAKQGWDSISGLFKKGDKGGGGTDAGKTLTNEGRAKGLTEAGSLSDGFGWNDAGGVIGGAQSLLTDEGKFAGAISGAMAGNQLGGWPGAIIGGALGYAQEGGYKDANPWDASGFSGLTMDAAWEDQNIARLASNPTGALASAVGVKSDSTLGKLLDPGSWLSKKGDEKRNLKAFTKEFPLMEGPNGEMALPDGKIISQKQLEKLAGAWYGAKFHPDGDQQKWEQTFANEVAKLYGGLAQGGSARDAIRPPWMSAPFVSSFDTESDMRHVRGPGSGRSDSIPAQLSDGEYVLTAEDVSMLGDGSNEAGAKKLDEFRTALRMHKGGALAQGKISPDAKSPLEYLKGIG